MKEKHIKILEAVEQHGFEGLSQDEEEIVLSELSTEWFLKCLNANFKHKNQLVSEWAKPNNPFDFDNFSLDREQRELLLKGA